MTFNSSVDTLLDRSIILGYSRIGPLLRRRWWLADPAAGSMAGRRVIVTGATSGIGLATAAGLAKLGAEVDILGRSREKLNDALMTLRHQVPHGTFHPQQCDISDLDDVRRFCSEYRHQVPVLAGLIHNAGAMTTERTETAAGHEVTYATHVLGPHLMTTLLRKELAASDAAIVIFVSSGGMYTADLRDDDPEYRIGWYAGAKAYARTKRMQVVLAQMWADRLADDHIAVESMHPGWVNTPGVAKSMPRFRRATLPVLRPLDEGADTLIWLAATRPDSRNTSHFWHDRRLRPTNYGHAKDEDPKKRERLWNDAAAATGTATLGELE